MLIRSNQLGGPSAKLEELNDPFNIREGFIIKIFVLELRSLKKIRGGPLGGLISFSDMSIIQFDKYASFLIVTTT